MIERAIKCGDTCTGVNNYAPNLIRNTESASGRETILFYEKGEEQIGLMRDIKKVFDPLGLLNPDKVFYSESLQ